MTSRALVVDANILVRAVLGRRVREVIETYAGDASFFVPEPAYAETEEHLAALVTKRGGDPEKALALLRSLGRLVDLIGSGLTFAENGKMSRLSASPLRQPRHRCRCWRWR